jgi:hypothetical protein
MAPFTKRYRRSPGVTAKSPTGARTLSTRRTAKLVGRHRLVVTEVQSIDNMTEGDGREEILDAAAGFVPQCPVHQSARELGVWNLAGPAGIVRLSATRDQAQPFRCWLTGRDFQVG